MDVCIILIFCNDCLKSGTHGYDHILFPPSKCFAWPVQKPDFDSKCMGLTVSPPDRVMISGNLMSN